MIHGRGVRRFHIGHHFFGSGNFGDDLMLAGFLAIARGTLPEATFTCSTPFDRECQQRRFPEIEWLAYDRDVRARAIDASDAWIGVGDTPFQTDVGAWFLEHLVEDADLCARSRKPMFFVGVGLNNRDALAHPLTRRIVGQAEHIWTRDEQAADLLREIRDPARVTLGADLANIYLARRQARPIEPQTLAFLLNFEEPGAYTIDAISEVVDATPGYRHRWLMQEVRPLDGSERRILAMLPETVRARLEVREPDYAFDSIETFLDRWGSPEVLVTSRYHGGLIGAWAGSRVVIVERNDKLTGLARQLRRPSLRDLRDGTKVREQAYSATPIDRDDLKGLADVAGRSVEELAEALAHVSADGDIAFDQGRLRRRENT